MDQRIILHINVKEVMYKYSGFDEEASFIIGFFIVYFFHI